VFVHKVVITRVRNWQGILGLVLLLVLIFSFTASARRPSRASQLPKQDENCLACHGQAGMKSEKGADISIRREKHGVSAHGVLGCSNCHTSIKEFPHPAKISKVKCETCHAQEASAAARSVHNLLGPDSCALFCHGNVHELTPATKLQPAKCGECHADELKELAQSIHGQAAQKGDPDAPVCASCHGAIHEVRASSEPSSTVAKKNMAATCAKCHADSGFLSRHKIPILHPVEQYLLSAHGRAVAAGKDAATCSNCHGSHGIQPARDARSKVSHWKMAETCGACHSEIASTYQQSVHGEAIKAGVQDAPDCSDCHGEHLILEPKNPSSPVNPAHVSGETCGRCHGDQRLALRYGLPADKVPSYAESYHGLAKREGSLTAANCASCHGIHNIFRTKDPRSTVNAANLAKTCGKCHGSVNEKFEIGPVHVQTASGPAHPVVKWIRWVYWVLIPLTLGFMVFHNLLDLVAKSIRGKQSQDSGQRLLRMNLWFRIAHWGVMASFPTLVLTGFALKYPDSWWSAPFLLWGKQDSFRPLLHRTAAVVLIAATLYHFIHLIVNRRDRAFLSAMMPKWKDASDLAGVVLHNLGVRAELPKYAKFNYAEKMEYWAFLWGTAVMGVSGFLLWFNNIALRYFPKWITDAATAVHWYEALLATFSILLWHFYQVIFDPLVYPMDAAWLHGKVPAEHYRHTRPEYFKALEKSGLVVPAITAAPEVGEKVAAQDSQESRKP
jgi:cytochrome b subunit of formate dehydrogenase